jgi:Flp pilus assembly pilin Flp
MSVCPFLSVETFALTHLSPMSTLTRLLRETDGQDIVEYALLTAFIGMAGAAAWSAMLTAVGNMFTGVSGVVWNRWEPADPVGGGS